MTVADQQKQAIEKAIVVYPDVYVLAGDKDNQYEKWIDGKMSALHK